MIAGSYSASRREAERATLAADDPGDVELDASVTWLGADHKTSLGTLRLSDLRITSIENGARHLTIDIDVGRVRIP